MMTVIINKITVTTIMHLISLFCNLFFALRGNDLHEDDNDGRCYNNNDSEKDKYNREEW